MILRWIVLLPLIFPLVIGKDLKCPHGNFPVNKRATCDKEEDCVPTAHCYELEDENELIKYCCETAKCWDTEDQESYIQGDQTCGPDTVYEGHKHGGETLVCCEDMRLKASTHTGYTPFNRCPNGDGNECPTNINERIVNYIKCETTADCPTDEDVELFCAEATLKNKNPKGKWKFCFEKPKSDKGDIALLNAQGVAQRCQTNEDCKSISNKPVKCMPGKINGIELHEKYCFEDHKCPLGGFSPELSLRCYQDKHCQDKYPGKKCLEIDSLNKESRCCEIAKCHGNTQPQFYTDRYNFQACTDISEPHPEHPDVCCQPWISPHVLVYNFQRPVSNKTCANHNECLEYEVCSVSIMNLIPLEEINGKTSHCYKIPTSMKTNETGLSHRAIRLNDMGLATCRKNADCPSKPYSVECKRGFLNGEESEIVLCYETHCRYGLRGTFSQGCEKDVDCPGDTQCTYTEGRTSKICCPIAPENWCYNRTQLPTFRYSVRSEPKTWIDNVDNTILACEQFIYKDFGEEKPLFSSNGYKQCTKNSDCISREFCGNSVLNRMASKQHGTTKHCFPLPTVNGTPALQNDQDFDLIKCDKHEDCSTKFPGRCEVGPSGSKLCFSSEIDFHNVCIVVDPTLLVCPGNVAPMLDKDYIPLTTCDSEFHFSKTVGEKKICCVKIISKFLFHDIPKRIVHPINFESCVSNDNCESNEFCSDSLNFQNKMDYAVPLRLCYKAGSDAVQPDPYKEATQAPPGGTPPPYSPSPNSPSSPNSPRSPGSPIFPGSPMAPGSTPSSSPNSPGSRSSISAGCNSAIVLVIVTSLFGVDL